MSVKAVNVFIANDKYDMSCEYDLSILSIMQNKTPNHPNKMQIFGRTAELLHENVP